MNDEVVRITTYNYIYGFSFDRYFDLEFSSGGIMVLIPVGYDFYDVNIRRLSSLEKELY
jgi:hypothetical protein